MAEGAVEVEVEVPEDVYLAARAHCAERDLPVGEGPDDLSEYEMAYIHGWLLAFTEPDDRH